TTKAAGCARDGAKAGGRASSPPGSFVRERGPGVAGRVAPEGGRTFHDEDRHGAAHRAHRGAEPGLILAQDGKRMGARPVAVQRVGGSRDAVGGAGPQGRTSPARVLRVLDDGYFFRGIIPFDGVVGAAGQSWSGGGGVAWEGCESCC